ncbi:MAG: tetratricopeptide repeat protein, partial [Myxococcota bacterium]
MPLPGAADDETTQGAPVPDYGPASGPAPGTPSPPPSSAVAASPGPPHRFVPPPRPSEGSSPEAADRAGRELRHRCAVELRTNPLPARQARLHFELARVAPTDEMRLKALDAALEAHPEFLPALRLAREIRLNRGEVARGLEHLDVELRLESRPKVRASLLRHKGRALEGQPGGADAARQCYLQATQSAPLALGPLRARVRVERAAGAWPSVDETRRDTVAATQNDPRHRAALLVERAATLENRLGAPDAAIELYGEALRLDPGVSRAAPSLKRLLHERGRWHDLMGVLEREATTTTDAAVRAQAFFRIGRIRSERLGDDVGAADALERALSEAPRDALVHESLERLYHRSGDHARLARVLAHAVENLAPTTERVGLLHRIGALFEGPLGDADQAREWYASALRLAPSHPPTVAALDRILGAAGAWEALIVVHLGAAEATEDSARRAGAHARIAEIFERHAKRFDEAIRHLQLALSLDADHEGAFKSLVRLYRHAGHYRALVAALERAAARARPGETRFAYLMQVGALHEDHLDQPDEAIRTYRRILRARPGHLEALHAWQRAAERSGRDRELVAALEGEATLTDDETRKLGLWQRSAEVLARIGAHDEAVARWRDVLRLDPHYGPALTGLGALFHAMGRPADQRDILTRELDVAAPGEAQVALLYQLGQLSELSLGDDAAAVDYYRRALAIDPSHEPSRRAVARSLRAQGDFEALAALLRLERGAARTDADAAVAAYRLGEVYEIHLGRDAEALAAYCDALDHAPHHRSALDGSLRVRARLQRWREQAEALEADARRVDDVRLAIDALLRAGEIFETHLEAPARAISAFEAVRSIESDNVSALLALEPLYSAASEPEKLMEVYATLARVASAPQQRVAALDELAHLQIGDPAALLTTCREILAIEPTETDALRRLESLARGLGDPGLTAEVHRRLAAAEVDPLLVARHLATAGESEEPGDPRRALEAFRSALEYDPDHIAAIRGLARTAEVQGDHLHAIDAYQREAKWTQNGELAAEALVRSAELRLEQDAATLAISDLEQALARWPDHEGAARMLDELRRARGEIEPLLVHLARAAGAAVTPRRRSALWRVVARLHAHERGDLAAAFGALERLLDAGEVEGETHALLGTLRRRNRQPEEAAAAFRAALETGGTNKELRARMHWALAELAAEQHERRPSSDHRREALTHLRKLLQLRPRHREGWLLRLELHREAGDDGAARAAAQNLLPLTTSVDERAWLYRVLGGIEDRAGRRREACSALWEAVAIEGPHGGAATHYKRLLDEDEPWTRYVDALEEHLRRREHGDGAATTGPRRDVYIALGQIHHEVLLDHDRAVAALERGLEGREDPTLRHELARRLLTMGRWDASRASFRRLAIHDPTDVDAWRGLARTHHEAAAKLEAGLALAPVVLLGEATDLERGMARQRRTVAGGAAPGSLGPKAIEQVAAVDPAHDPRLVALLEGIGEVLPRLTARTTDATGLKTRDRVAEDHPLVGPLRVIGHALGLEHAPELFVRSSARGLEVATPAGERPRLVISRKLAECPLEERVFAFARALVPWAQGTLAVPLLGPQQSAILIAAAIGLAAPGWGHTRIPGDELERASRHLGKALSRRQRKLIEQTLAPACLRGSSPDVERFV